MNLPDTFKTITDRIHSSASVKTVYGDPVEAEGKTIIPVARVRFGFGAGGGTTPVPQTNADAEAGSANDTEPSASATASGGGGGGGVEVSPVGIIEITETQTRFISFEDRPRMIKAGLIALALGLFLWRRRRRG